jgi:hypothetical protein
MRRTETGSGPVRCATVFAGSLAGLRLPCAAAAYRRPAAVPRVPGCLTSGSLDDLAGPSGSHAGIAHQSGAFLWRARQDSIRLLATAVAAAVPARGCSPSRAAAAPAA